MGRPFLDPFVSLSSCAPVRAEFEKTANRAVYPAPFMDGHPQEIRKHHLRHSADFTVRGDSRPEGAIQAANTQFALFFFHFGEPTDLFQDRKSLYDALLQSYRSHHVAEACCQSLPDSAENLI
jgi:hypothetical protein